MADQDRRLHVQRITDDAHGRFWRYGRLILRWYPDTEKSCTWEVDWSWRVLKKGGSLGFSIGTGTGQDDEHLSTSLHLGRLGAWYFNGHGRLFAPMRHLQGSEHPRERELSLKAHNGLICWNLWTATMGYNPKAKWREQCWSWKRFIGWTPNHVEWKTLDVVRTVVPMPEGTYDATVEIKRGTWKRRRLFFWWPAIHHFDYDITPDRPIPVPGKGENSWDCGDDAIYSSSGSGRTVHAAVSSLVDSVYRQRTQYGSGPSWQPAEANDA
jgi:hypothetical protein